MTKQEKIKEAYGEKYNPYNIDENGWMKYNLWMHFFKKVDDDYDEFDNRNMRVRPNLLTGIENNNGWIKIEEKSNTKWNNSFDIVFTDKGNIYTYATYCNFSSINELEKITHFQQIIKPNKPIY